LLLPAFSAVPFNVRYGYDGAGRISAVTSSLGAVTNNFTLSYLTGTALLSGIASDGGIERRVAYEQNRDLISAVSNHVNHVNPVLISAYDYANDAAGRRVSRNTDSFTFNSRSEVIGAAIGTNDYGYAYDAIGNRVWSAANTLTNTYAANSLNQYSLISNHVNHVNPVRIHPTYDADGNMRWDGRMWHTWDAENRLVRSEPGLGGATNGSVRVVNDYDHRHRRIQKRVEVLTGRGSGYPMDPSQPGTWDAVETRRYVWDGYNIAAEIVIDEVTSATNVTYYTWGLDLSGTLQGAGGVGGLLAVTTSDLAQPDSLTTYYPSYDANGNITEYVDGNGAVVAHYEYSPFGEIVTQSGDMADTFTHRFSTKPWCPITGLSEYELRKYSPDLGRWLSRDPIGEEGGVNLHAMVGNRIVDDVDVHGRRGHGSKKKRQLKKLPGECSGVAGEALNLCLEAAAHFRSKQRALDKGRDKCTSQKPRYTIPSSSTPILTKISCHCCVIGIRVLNVNDSTFYYLAYATVHGDDCKATRRLGSLHSDDVFEEYIPW
jgi:RHS repeat-associated protein